MAITKRSDKGSALTYTEMDDNFDAIAPRTSATGALQIPAGATGDRPGSPQAGHLRFNTSTNTFEGYASGTWGGLGGGGGVGVQGVQGITGAGVQGPAGLNGSNGTNGTDGAQGIQGFKGDQGNPGINGTNGTNGTDGAQGVQGLKGDQGLPGDGNQGTQGTTGFQGPAGSVQGMQGIQGVDGIGADGAQGIQGLQGGGGQGVQGLQGDRGFDGQPGFQGIQGGGGQGVQGIQGDLGPAGFGAQGIQGTQGLIGPGGTGPQGIQGLQGPGSDLQGVQGIQGFQGPSLQGLQGPAGSVQGIQGPTGVGDTGAQGIQGIQGDFIVGDQGPQGAQGLQGDLGLQGVQGPSIIGPQGTQGIIGSQGTTGEQGISIQGAQGIQGPSLQGLTGFGVQGVQGPQGFGPQGTTGFQGFSGEGLQGLTGPSGPQGIQGVGGGGGTMSNLVEDTTPQLGGDLETQQNDIIFGASAFLRMANVSEFRIRTQSGAEAAYDKLKLDYLGNLSTGPIISGYQQNSSGFTSGSLEIRDNTSAPFFIANTSSFFAHGLSYPTTDGAGGQFLMTNGSGALSFMTITQATGSELTAIVDDTSPVLGGNLDANGFSVSNLNAVNGMIQPAAIGANNQVLIVGDSAAGTLAWTTLSSFSDMTVSGTLTGYTHKILTEFDRTVGFIHGYGLFSNGTGEHLRIEGGTAESAYDKDIEMIGAKIEITAVSDDIIIGNSSQTNNIRIGSDTYNTPIRMDGQTTFLGTISEKTNAIPGASGVETHNLNNGAVFDHSSIAGNFTANFTNVPTTNSRTIGVALILSQGGTAYMPTAVQIDGSAQTILWQGGSAPSGTANGTDVVSFTLIRSSAGAWKVIGSSTSYS
jgi:hypothetical protein